jgi:hypothetical protein
MARKARCDISKETPPCGELHEGTGAPARTYCFRRRLIPSHREYPVMADFLACGFGRAPFLYKAMIWIYSRTPQAFASRRFTCVIGKARRWRAGPEPSQSSKFNPPRSFATPSFGDTGKCRIPAPPRSTSMTLRVSMGKDLIRPSKGYFPEVAGKSAGGSNLLTIFITSSLRTGSAS